MMLHGRRGEFRLGSLEPAKVACINLRWERILTSKLSAFLHPLPPPHHHNMIDFGE